MAKKKKTQLKPVARVFATTSIPKKTVQAEEIAPPTPDEVPSDGLVTGVAEAIVDHQAVVLHGVLPESDSKLVVDQEEQPFFQIMIDKYQEKTEKDISRTIKVSFPNIHHYPFEDSDYLCNRRWRWISVSPKGSTP